jgi:hypothetical protein
MLDVNWTVFATFVDTAKATILDLPTTHSLLISRAVEVVTGRTTL